MTPRVTSYFLNVALVLVAMSCALEAKCETALSAGLTASSGLGEQSYSTVLRARATGPHLEGVASFDRSSKNETGSGWIAGLDADARLRFLILGADYRHRDGGSWSKDVAFVRVGAGVGPARLIYRHEVYSSAPVPNRARFLEFSARHRFHGGVFCEGLVSTGRYQQSGRTKSGTYSQVSAGYAWRSR